MLPIIQLLIVLACLYFGARRGGVALGVISGIGLAILVFFFQMEPGSPPTTVIYIIIAAVTTAGILQAAGGMDFLIQIAERFLRKHPSRITFLAPYCTFFLTVLCGTGHVVYTLMPIIADISLKNGIRPERPVGVSSIASQVGITCSPIAAAVVAFVTMSSTHNAGVSILQVLAVTLPACMIGIFFAALYSSRRGKDLADDPQYQARLSDPKIKEYMFGETITSLEKKLPKSAKLSVLLFCCALILIGLFAMVPDLLPVFGTPAKSIKMTLVIQIVMLLIGGLILLICRVKPTDVVQGTVFQAGMVAVVAIYGIAWLSDTYFGTYIGAMKESISVMVQAAPWAFAFALFGVSVLINTQGGTVLAVMPLGFSLGIPVAVLVGIMPSVYGYFFIPNYPSDIAAMNFDRSGTTTIGKYLLNHSFMAPGLISVITSCIIGYFWAQMII
ncbi:MAG: anaerobic C4-dicarboxylate transporter [Proteobacteria bacterium]|nr:anaerobic C4-dicarboxylate transporter [Desulfobacula sp.]MBU3953237.1 anaerobic C4-dicarboxylate transporter [Pseudomonadota bacterium]